MGTYAVFFRDAGVPATGLTVTVESFLRLSDQTTVTPDPSITETGGGWYQFDYTPTEDVVIVLDGSSSLDDADRYKGGRMSPRDGAQALEATLGTPADTSLATDIANLVTTIGTPADTDIATDIANLAAGGDLDQVIEGTITMRQALRALLALVSKTSGGGTTTITYRDTGDTKDRITYTVDTNGNRSTVTLDLT